MQKEVLYKYMPMTQSYCWESLEKSYWYFSHRDDFNDPFDFQIHWTFDNGTYGNVKNRIVDKLETTDANKIDRMFADANNHPAMSDLVHVIQSHKLLTDRVLFEALGSPSIPQGIEMFLNQIGILCLSKSPDVHLMWAHYANSHRGFCIGYDIDAISKKSEEEKKIARGDVTYCDRTIIPIDASKASKNTNYLNDKIKESINKKNTHWSYEQEVRFVLLDKARTIFFLEKNASKRLSLALKQVKQIRQK